MYSQKFFSKKSRLINSSSRKFLKSKQDPSLLSTIAQKMSGKTCNKKIFSSILSINFLITGKI